jgi:hypothetical protein
VSKRSRAGHGIQERKYFHTKAPTLAAATLLLSEPVSLSALGPVRMKALLTNWNDYFKPIKLKMHYSFLPSSACHRRGPTAEAEGPRPEDDRLEKAPSPPQVLDTFKLPDLPVNVAVDCFRRCRIRI